MAMAMAPAIFILLARLPGTSVENREATWVDREGHAQLLPPLVKKQFAFVSVYHSSSTLAGHGVAGAG